MADAPKHHIVYGTLKDFITGEELPDTDDERFRQKIARFLVEKKGYKKEEITPRLRICTEFSGNKVCSRIDFLVTVNDISFMVVRYGPGSIVTRQRSAIAAAKVLNPEYQIPIAVATNGEDAAVMDVFTGKVIGEGFDAIPSRDEAIKMLKDFKKIALDEKKKERELRILNAYDVDMCSLYRAKPPGC